MRGKGKRSGIWAAVGSLLIAAALLLCAYNIWDSRRAAASVQNVLNAMGDVQFQAHTESGTSADEAETMAAVPIDGNAYIGTLALPTLDMTLPVMADWDYDKLKIAPCRYSGTTAGDLVIAGHNYRSHFGPLDRLHPGDTVCFNDVQGNAFTYVVVETEILPPTAVEEMVDDDWDLTLFTCTLSGQARFTVRCARR